MTLVSVPPWLHSVSESALLPPLRAQDAQPHHSLPRPQGGLRRRRGVRRPTPDRTGPLRRPALDSKVIVFRRFSFGPMRPCLSWIGDRRLGPLAHWCHPESSPKHSQSRTLHSSRPKCNSKIQSNDARRQPQGPGAFTCASPGLRVGPGAVLHPDGYFCPFCPRAGCPGRLSAAIGELRSFSCLVYTLHTDNTYMR